MRQASGDNPSTMPPRDPSASSSAVRLAHRETCIALLDAHFLAWLQGQDEGSSHQNALRGEGLSAWLTGSLADEGVQADLVRIYWYTSQPDTPAINGQVVRLVLPEAADAGASLVQAMARDLTQLAEHRACAHLLLASDDDRLLTAVDAAQLRGAQVHLLVDEKAADLAALSRTDAAWAALLRQADRRIVGRAVVGGTPASPLMAATGMQAAVQVWWASLSDLHRDELLAQLPRNRGLPQEADRQLLLRLSQQLGRSLELPERKLMRETARARLENLPSRQDLPEDDS